MNHEKVQRRKQHRPQELIEAGLQEFALNGFAATRMVDIATRAKVSKGTIYVYYKSKGALFEAAIRSQILPHIEHLDKMVSAYEGTTKDLIKMIVHLMYDRIIKTNASSLIRVMIAEGPKFPDLVDFYYNNVLKRGLSILEKVVVRGMKRGEIAGTAIEKEPRLLIAPIVFAAVWTMLFNRQNPLNAEQFCNVHLDVLFNGILVKS